MIRTMIGVAVVTLLFAGPAVLDASAQSSSDQPSQSTAPAMPKASAKSHMAAKHKSASEPEESPAAAGLAYPPCSRTVRDQCIQLWQTNLSKAYPQCTRLKGSVSKAACIEDAYKQQKS